MYYPYLRARQFELIALRELATEGDLITQYVTPVLEPVRDNFNGFNLANQVFQEHNFTAYVIVNPQVGEIAGNSNIVLDYLNNLQSNNFKPAFIYADNKDYIEQSIEEYNLTNCMLISFGNYTNENDFKTLCTKEDISHIMVSDPGKDRSLNRFIQNLHKTHIRLDDIFNKEEKNADYLNIAAHKISEEHIFYEQENYQGFADFTLLPSEHTEGGFTPWAVAIHISYINSSDSDSLWIRHFTSESNDSDANVQGKFAEAARKAVEFCEREGLNNSAIAELKRYFYDIKYPGLGVVKKISIKNHIITLKNYLNEKSIQSM